MKLGDLCRSRYTTAFYVSFREDDHDRHGELYPSDLLVYLGESYAEFSKVALVSNGKSGWTFRSFLEVL